MDIKIINITDFNDTKIKFSPLINISVNKKKINIEYDEDSFYLLSPYFINNTVFISNINYNFIKITFDPFIGSIYKFYKIIEQIENNIKLHIEKIMLNYNFVSILKKEQFDHFDQFEQSDHFDQSDQSNQNDQNDQRESTNISYINLKLNLNLSDQFITNNKITKIYKEMSECNIEKLKKGWKYKCLIYFNHIWIDTIKKRYGLNLDLIQLKIHEPSYLSGCLIDNIDSSANSLANNSTINLTNSSTINSNNLIKPIIQNNIINFNNKNLKQNPIMILPNAMELLNMKNALKKVLI